MLNVIVGRSRLERGKSAGIVVLLSLSVLSLVQLSSDRIASTRDQRDREWAMSIARRFALALTTYDYAHPGAQTQQVAPISSSAIRDRVADAAGDVASSRASSIGD